MSFLLSWTTWIFGGLAVLLVAALFLSAWMFAEYFSLKGHFDPEDELVGQVGTVRKECSPHQRGKVYIAGAYWDAVSDFGSIQEGEDIEVVAVKGKFLVVRKVDLVSGKA